MQRRSQVFSLCVGALLCCACNMSVLDGLGGAGGGDPSRDGAMPPGDGDGDGGMQEPGEDGEVVEPGDGGTGTPEPDAYVPPEETMEFFSSFEEADPAPRWLSTVEVDQGGQPRAQGVTGQSTDGILGSLVDQIVAVTASAENPPAEVASAAFDGDVTTKWLAFSATGTLQLELAAPEVVTRYAISSANDYPDRDPRDWFLEGSADGASWTVLDQQSAQSFPMRYETKQYAFANSTAYAYYRLNVTRVNGGAITQLSEFQVSTGDDTPPSETSMKTLVGRGPGASFNAKLSAGFTGTRALRFSGSVPGSGRGYSYNKVFDVNVKVTAESQLSYLIFPDETPDDPTYPSTHVAVDLAFDDGSYLSELSAEDQDHAVFSPQGQGASRMLYAGEWNRKVVDLGAVAEGKNVRRILVGYDNPKGPAPRFGGFIDDVRITAESQVLAPEHLSEYVITTRGTNSGGDYARGNTFPATAVPHGFNFWTPVTDASTDAFLYSYHRSNNEANLPVLQALSLSHQPSPWLGDRQSFQIMPWGLSGLPDTNRGARALPFRHENEIAQPHYYSVTFENGIRAEITPTDHAAMFRFTFPSDSAALIFDGLDANGGLTLDAGSRALAAYTDARSGSSAGSTRMFVYATFDQAVASSDVVMGPAGYMRFLLSGGQRVVTMRIASSLISLEQAKKNLALEISDDDTFDTVKARAQKLWDDKLGIVTVEGASEDQLITLYSNLYRLFLYPNSGFENVGTDAAPVYRHASPVLEPSGTNTATATGATLRDGKVYVNNGFWDTYRATWPAYALFTPTQAGEMIDGFLQLYRDGKWTARWSSPGFADLMTGTSSDVAFADAYLKGVNFDVETAYEAAVKNATVRPDNSAVGRKGYHTAIFLGYTATDTEAGFSWSMASYLNDFGISQLASALGASAGPRQQEYQDSAEYFLERSLNYAKLYDPATKFFQGRAFNGQVRVAAAQYDPRVWGFDYTETNGWNMAFEPTHDGQGLANLYGGTTKLRDKLDAFFDTPELADKPGSYGGVIHEMREARDVRLGQLGLSNQASFHIPYMYLYAREPAKTQRIVRDALARLFLGSRIGQGYLGDDDNGSLSAWQIFGALGFYPLQVGSPSYVLGSPLFEKATVRLENGKTIVVTALNNGPKNVYVQSVKLNDAPHARTYVAHDTLVAGATLEFTMGPEPSMWGTGAADVPPSITTGSAAPTPLSDATRSGGMATPIGGVTVNALFDDNSLNKASFAAADPVVQYAFVSKTPAVEFYTLTSNDGVGPNGTVDPTGWVLSGSSNGTDWTVIDARTNQVFTDRLQTRAFKVANPVAYKHYKLELTMAENGGIAEVELLAR